MTEAMTPGSVLGIAITCNLGLITIFGIIVRGWVSSTRVEKMEASIKALEQEIIQLKVFDNRLKNVEDGVHEIRDMLKEDRDRDK